MAVIEVEGIGKSFGDVTALAGIDFAVEEGTVYGLLGPNGAGKTTAVRILTTLLKPDSGRASVAGFDVVHEARRLRASIGLAGQYAAVDEILTGRENLEMVGKLYRMGKARSAKRAEELLELFELTEASDRLVRTYSGGMRRRLDLGASLVGSPKVLFLDEPTTGLDPRSRRRLWEFIERLVGGGTTLLLTTQYLEEADRLADRIGVIDEGRLIDEGTSEELKRRFGGDVIEFQFSDPAVLDTVASLLTDLGSDPDAIIREDTTLRLPVANAARVVSEAVRRLDDASITLADLAIHRPTLDDVFLSLTGHHAEEVPAPAAADRKRRRRRRP